MRDLLCVLRELTCPPAYWWRSVFWGLATSWPVWVAALAVCLMRWLAWEAFPVMDVLCAALSFIAGGFVVGCIVHDLAEEKYLALWRDHCKLVGERVAERVGVRQVTVGDDGRAG